MKIKSSDDFNFIEAREKSGLLLMLLFPLGRSTEPVASGGAKTIHEVLESGLQRREYRLIKSSSA